MKRMNQKILVDLAALTVKRVGRNLDDVTQLVESDADCHTLYLGVAATIIARGSELMRDSSYSTVNTLEDAQLMALARIAHMLGLKIPGKAARKKA